jgi:peptidyl-prolyl cis-trans isomerase B (cyclophilin B)
MPSDARAVAARVPALHSLLLALLPFLAAPILMPALDQHADAAADLAPKTTFAKPGAALVATLSGVDAPCELVLLDRDAKELARATAAPGEVDLAALFPAIQELPRAARVQAIVAGTPDGAPLLVVPLVPRAAIRTITDLRPDGKTPFTRVIGYGDELLDPANAAHAKAKESWQKADPTPRSGFRLERDRDVVFETSAGTIRFAMCPDEAPNSARNFVELAERGFYDGTIVHRIVPADRNGLPFVIQGGDPTGTGDGGPGYDLPLEPSRLAHDFGVVSMARSDWPDSAGSQWFVCLSREATARLDGQYCAFGYAVKGADAVLKIADGEIADPATGRPKSPETVVRAFTVPSPAWTPGVGRPDARIARPAPSDTAAPTAESDR